jgi:hypothetical protein
MSEIVKAQEQANSFITEIDAAELAVRLIERGCHMKRPAGLTGSAAWAQFEHYVATGQVPEYIVRDFEAMAHIAIAYFGECIDGLQRRN